MKTTPENLKWFDKNIEKIDATFNINERIPRTLQAYRIFTRFFSSKEEFNDLKNWEGTPWEDSKNAYAEISQLPGCVAEIDGKILFVDYQIHEMYFDELIAMDNNRQE